MKNTRFMERLFSATREGDEELTQQVADDIETAKAVGEVDTDEVKYENAGNGQVAITDKENGEVTLAEQGPDGNYDLSPLQVTGQLEGFIHPGMDGVTPGSQQGEMDEHAGYHIPEGSISGIDELSWEDYGDGCCEGCGEKSFSVYSDNFVVQKIFSDQEFCERVFSEVIESEETAKVGDLKIEKCDDEDNCVIVTSESTGDQAKVTLEDDEMEVTELDSKNFSDEEEQYDPLHVVGVDVTNHMIVDAPEYDEESAQALVERLTESGVDGCQIFDSADEARDYAFELLGGLDVKSLDHVDEPEEVAFSDLYGFRHSGYVTKFYTDNTEYMDRSFSENLNDLEVSREELEDAIENGDQIENDTEIITPIDAKSAVIEDKESGEFTKAVIDSATTELVPLSRSEARDLTANIEVDEDSEEDEDEEKSFSDVWTDDTETRFFSENEILTEYMTRLFSGDSDEEAIEDAIENGDQVENDTEIITPIDAKTAVIEDKESGEFTKAVMDDEDIDLSPISEEEAEELTANLEIEDTDEDEDEEKDFSDVWTDDTETRFFSENEILTEYMTRLFTEESDEEAIEDAIENGDQVENDTEVITPIDAKTAVVEDKESGEFTKAVMDEDGIDLTPISEEEAEELTEDLEIEDTDKDEDKNFSFYEDPILDKFFADVVDQTAAQAAQAQMAPQQMMAPQQQMMAPQQSAAQAPIQPTEDGGYVMEEQPSIEMIEDKAIAAVQSIQAAAAEAEAMIMNAKAAPMEQVEPDLQEAQFSYYFDDYEDDLKDRMFSDAEYVEYEEVKPDTLVSFLSDVINK